MKKEISTIMLFLVCTLLSFVLGWTIALATHTDSEGAHRKKVDIINLQYDALEKVDIIMDKHYLYDIDGSDDMVEYLSMKAKLDSIWDESI